MALPPLRTVRDTAPEKASQTPPPVATVANVFRHTEGGSTTPVLVGPSSAPTSIRLLLGEVLHADLLDPKDIDRFLAKAGPKLRDMNSRENAASALVHLGFLTAFQMERVLSRNTFGLVFGNYRIEDRVGGGTVGIVFRAVHKSLKRGVAIKVVPGDESTPPQFLERFDLEMELMARVDHPNVVRVYDIGTLAPNEAGLAPLRYAILEHIDGSDLEDYVYKHGIVPVSLAAEWGRQLAAGLGAAHAHNLVHRDFKPSNVLITSDRRAKVSDFGLARHFASISTPRPGLVGSVEFMSPEQVADASTVGPSADIYALGATLFWCLTGQLPYQKAVSTKEALNQIRTAAPRRLRQINTELPPELDDLLARMMARNPSERPTAIECCSWLGSFAVPSAHPAMGSASAPAEVMSESDLLRFAISHLEETLAVRESLAQEASHAVLTALARVTQFRGESAGLQKRLQEYVRAMAAKLAMKPDWVMFADPAYLADTLRAIPTRNVGLAGVPDHVLCSGELSSADQAALERHPLVGCHILDVIVARHGKALPYARIARDVIRSHHEKWDGTGFPDRLKKEEIPHSARLVAVAEAYDALRQPQDNEPGLSHEQAIEGLIQESKGYFDPTVLDAMVAAHHVFAELFALIPN